MGTKNISKHVQVVGAGLAGLAAALSLAKRGFSVRVIERRTYPCVKLCGEFLSPDGIEVLSRLTAVNSEQIMELLEARTAHKFSWITRKGRQVSLELAPAGWSVRRDRLDPWLAEMAGKQGVELVFGRRVRTDETREKQARRDQQELWATGKEQPGLKSPFFAIKGYCIAPVSTAPEADLVLYQLHGGYIGFTRMQSGELSYCALFDRRRTEQGWRYNNWETLCDGVLRTNSALSAWAKMAKPTLETHVGAASFDFRSREPVRGSRWYVGDAVQLVPPFVGDGMAMALEGGELAAAALEAGCSDAEYAKMWRGRFSGRLRLANALHPYLWTSGSHETLAYFLQKMPIITSWLYTRTRGKLPGLRRRPFSRVRL